MNPMDALYLTIAAITLASCAALEVVMRRRRRAAYRDILAVLREHFPEAYEEAVRREGRGGGAIE